MSRPEPWLHVRSAGRASTRTRKRTHARTAGTEHAQSWLPAEPGCTLPPVPVLIFGPSSVTALHPLCRRRLLCALPDFPQVHPTARPSGWKSISLPELRVDATLLSHRSPSCWFSGHCGPLLGALPSPCPLPGCVHPRLCPRLLCPAGTFLRCHPQDSCRPHLNGLLRSSLPACLAPGPASVQR